MLGLVLLLVPIICLHHAFYKIHPWKLFVFGKIFAHGKIKSGRKSQGKKTESRPKEERKSTILSRKEKYSFVKVIGTGGAPCWRQDFDWRSPRRTKICQTLLKTRFPFLHASTSLDKKTWTIASNRNFESCICRFVVLLLSTFSGFSIFAAGSSFAFGNFTHYCVVLLNVPLSDLGEKKDTCLQWVTFPGKSRSIVDPRGSRCLIGLRVSGGEIISWLGTSCLRTFMS